ncbi:MAG: hypothetical protein ACLTXT_01950 [Ruminococcus callidus]
MDGKVDIADAVLLNKATAGVVELNESARTNADCDADAAGGMTPGTAPFLVHIINSLPEQVKERLNIWKISTRAGGTGRVRCSAAIHCRADSETAAAAKSSVPEGFVYADGTHFM